MSFFVKNFSMFMKKIPRTYQNSNQNYKKDSSSDDMACSIVGRLATSLLTGQSLRKMTTRRKDTTATIRSLART